MSRTKRNELPRRYSGELSKPFWRAVNAIKDKSQREAAYHLGCTLQDLEIRVLQVVRRVPTSQDTGEQR